jgi:hypothetical protein
MKENPIQRATVANWTMDAMGSIVGMDQLNKESMGCGVEVLSPGPDGEDWKIIGCEPIAERELGIKFEQSDDHVFITWIGLVVHSIVWGGLTFIILYRRKGS